jgi:hypothetical protein
MCGIFSSPSIPAPPPPVAAPSKSDAEVKAAEADRRKQLAAAKGRESTILTGGTGAADEGASQKKTLLGQ